MPSRVGCASGDPSVPVPSPHGSGVPVENHPYPYRALTGWVCQWRSTRTRTEPSRVGCASGEAPVPVPSPHGLGVPVQKE
ncbi:hypothetical protein EOD39_8909 [Acipenser ruthenus]|uniref:Uncharacterized protein n=1 Tax=Acipenser ruthenus TaxID=7906 RepID=A0A444U276_ACIRT|nr:hypothetical protein EOD39_8909 [Acipenser ruthenus]